MLVANRRVDQDESMPALPEVASVCAVDDVWLHCDHMTITTRIVRIGNSRGIRVPKLLLDQSALPDEVQIKAEPGRLVVSAARRARAGWAEAAQHMHASGDDVVLDAPMPTRFDRSGWKW